MNWSKELSPNEEVGYNHIKCHSPLGWLIIDWKGWKQYPIYDLWLDGEHIKSSDNINSCKTEATNYLTSKYNELKEFLK